MLVQPKVPPGLWANGTVYQSKGRWYDASLVRCIAPSTVQPWGGWTELLDASGDPVTVTGAPRALLGWRGNDDQTVLAIGTNEKLYALTRGVLYDITPAGFVAGAVSTAFSGGVASSGEYGSGLYSEGPYGVADPLLQSMVPATTWQLDTFGEYLLGCASPSDGKLYVWENDILTDAAQIAGSPVSCRGLVVTPERFLFALGAGGDARRIEWPSQETLIDWTPSSSNTAGGWDLEGVGTLVTGRRGEGETLIWTTDDMYAARYIGGTLLYTFRHLGSQCGLVSPGAVAVLSGGRAAWMSDKHFHFYDGAVRTIPCEVSDRVFGDFNYNQREKVVCSTSDRWNEIQWYYPSAGSSENDRYVTWNPIENHWMTGALSRTAIIDAGALQYPMAATAAGDIFEHDKGTRRFDADGENILPFITSGPVELGDGDQIMHVSGLVPDERVLNSATYTLFGSLAPGEDEVERGSFSTGSEIDLRFTARAMRVRIQQGVESDWRAGFPRMLVMPAGRRGPRRPTIRSGLHDGLTDHGGTYWYL